MYRKPRVPQSTNNAAIPLPNRSNAASALTGRQTSQGDRRTLTGRIARIGPALVLVTCGWAAGIVQQASGTHAGQQCSIAEPASGAIGAVPAGEHRRLLPARTTHRVAEHYGRVAVSDGAVDRKRTSDKAGTGTLIAFGPNAVGGRPEPLLEP